MLSSELWWEGSEEYGSFLDVCVRCPCPEVELSKVNYEVIKGGLGERRSGDNVEEYEFHHQGFVGEDTGGNISWNMECTCECY